MKLSYHFVKKPFHVLANLDDTSFIVRRISNKLGMSYSHTMDILREMEQMGLLKIEEVTPRERKKLYEEIGEARGARGFKVTLTKRGKELRDLMRKALKILDGHGKA